MTKDEVFERLRVLARLERPVWLAGGVSVDFHLGRWTRDHHDIDLVTFEEHREGLDEELTALSFERTGDRGWITSWTYSGSAPDEVSLAYVRLDEATGALVMLPSYAGVQPGVYPGFPGGLDFERFATLEDVRFRVTSVEDEWVYATAFKTIRPGAPDRDTIRQSLAVLKPLIGDLDAVRAHVAGIRRPLDDQDSRPYISRSQCTIVVGSRTFDDPFRALEVETAEVLAWQEGQRQIALAHLEGLPIRPHVEEALAAIRTGPAPGLPVRRGGRWFELSEVAGDRILRVFDDLGSEGEVVASSAALQTEFDPNTTIDWFFPSPDGEFVAFGVSPRGSELSTLLIARTRSSEVLPDRIPGATGASVAWLPGSRSFVVNASAGAGLRQSLFLHHIGADAPVPIGLDFGDAARIWPQVSADGRHIIVSTQDAAGLRPWYFCGTSTPTAWQPFLKDVVGEFMGTVVGGEFIAATSVGAPRGRVVAIPLSEPPAAQSRWRELIPEGEARIETVVAVYGGLLVQSFATDGMRLDFYDMQGGHRHQLPLPGRGEITILGRNIPLSPDPDWRELPVAFSSVDRSDSIYLHDLEQAETWPVRPPDYVDEEIVSEVLLATSRDGTQIPVTVFFRQQSGPRQARPTVLLAYGAHAMPLLPRFSSSTIVFLDAGGVFALPNLRGGGEFGAEWWKSGRRQHKQNTFDDLYAVVERLQEAGITERGRVGLIGGSAGGLLAGAAIAQRPELFAAVTMNVPILDLLRSAFVDEWDSGRFELGDARIPEEAEWLAHHSPYHLLRDGVEYPATLITAGARDPRCPPWHARKFAARLQQANAGNSPVLLNVIPEGGHLDAGGPDEAARHAASSLAFLMHHLGVHPV